MEIYRLPIGHISSSTDEACKTELSRSNDNSFNFSNFNFRIVVYCFGTEFVEFTVRDIQVEHQLLRKYLDLGRLMPRGVPRIWEGGGPRIFFFRFGNLHVAKRHAAHGEAMRIARGVRGHAPP